MRISQKVARPTGQTPSPFRIDGQAADSQSVGSAHRLQTRNFQTVRFSATMLAMAGRTFTKTGQPRKGSAGKGSVDSLSDSAAALLRAQGLKVTETRLVLLRALLERHKPSTAQELLEDLAGHGLDQVTVYRTLATLVENHIAQPVSTLDGTRRFEVHAGEGCRIDHPHLQCRRCGALECLEKGILPTPILPTRVLGYVIDEAKLYLLGLCPKCHKTDKNKAKGTEED